MTDVLISTVNFVLTVLYFVLFARILMSWFPGGKSGRIASVLFLLTEPFLAPIRKVLQSMQSGNGSGMKFDLSPLIAILIVQVVRMLVNGTV